MSGGRDQLRCAKVTPRWREQRSTEIDDPTRRARATDVDAPISRYIYPKLSTVHYPITDMSRMAARWVLKNVYRHAGLEVPQQFFEPNFVERDSVSRPA